MTPSLLVASRKGLFRFRHVRGTWKAAPPAHAGQPVTSVLTDPRTCAVYAALRLGQFGVKLHRSTDGGATWTEIAAPAFPKAKSMKKAKDAPAVDMIWTLVPGGEEEPGVLWAGAIPGGLFRSNGDDDSWSLMTSLWNDPARARWFGGGYDEPGIHSVMVHPKDSMHLTVGVSCGGIWRSEDGSETWRVIGKGLRAAYLPPEQAHDLAVQDPHRLAHCKADPRSLWCQHHNGIFRSRDGGETFREIKRVKPSVFGFAVAAHPEDPQTAWFAPGVKDEMRVPVDGKLVVTRTRDGAKTFEIQKRGLPRGPSYDLVYRHGLEVDYTGRRLAMGSTTGNLWVSETPGARGVTSRPTCRPSPPSPGADHPGIHPPVPAPCPAPGKPLEPPTCPHRIERRRPPPVPLSLPTSTS